MKRLFQCSVFFLLAQIALARPAVYPPGVWGLGGNSITPGLANNLGLVGVSIGVYWNEIEKSDGVYTWKPLDDKIAAAKAAGFTHLKVGVMASSTGTPTWLISQIQSETPSEVLTFLDNGHEGTTYCKPFSVVVYWNTHWHNKRLALIAAAGARYTADPMIDVTVASYSNHRTADWNTFDSVVILDNCTWEPSCTAAGLSTPCDIPVDQPLQWTNAGWTRARVLQVGKEIIQANADAWPNQSIALPIGGDADALANAPPGTSPDPRNGGIATYSTRAWETVDWARDTARDFDERFYTFRNTESAKWSTTPPSEPGYSSENYIKYMIGRDAPLSGLQTVTSVTLCECLSALEACRVYGSDPCNTLNGGGDGARESILQLVLDVAIGYDVNFLELWPDDSKNTDPIFYSKIAAATVAMGGTPRGVGDTPGILLFVQ